jgi:hypothetical protein
VLGIPDIIVTGSKLTCSTGATCISTSNTIFFGETNVAATWPKVSGDGAANATPAPAPTQCPVPPTSRPTGSVGVAGAALLDPLGFIIAYDVRNLAHSATQRRYGESGSDNESDAYRHFYGSFALSRLTSPTRAISILNANEVQNGGSNLDSIAMDTYNNWVGTALSQDSRFKGQSVAQAAEFALENNCLQLVP